MISNGDGLDSEGKVTIQETDIIQQIADIKTLPGKNPAWKDVLQAFSSVPQFASEDFLRLSEIEQKLQIISYLENLFIILPENSENNEVFLKLEAWQNFLIKVDSFKDVVTTIIAYINEHEQVNFIDLLEKLQEKRWLSEEWSMVFSDAYNFGMFLSIVLGEDPKSFLGVFKETTRISLVRQSEIIKKIQAGLSSIKEKSSRDEKLQQILMELHKSFWLREVSRPRLKKVTVKQNNGATREKVVGLEQDEIGDPLLNSEYGSYVSIRDFTLEMLQELDKVDQFFFGINLVYQKLRLMIFNPTRIEGVSAVPLEEKSEYSIIFHFEGKAKKILITREQLRNSETFYQAVRDRIDFSAEAFEKFKQEVISSGLRELSNDKKSFSININSLGGKFSNNRQIRLICPDWFFDEGKTYREKISNIEYQIYSAMAQHEEGSQIDLYSSDPRKIYYLNQLAVEAYSQISEKIIAEISQSHGDFLDRYLEEKGFSEYQLDEKAYKKALEGREKVQDVQGYRRDLNDFSAADLRVVFANGLDFSSPDDLQRDSRMLTYGARTPEVLGIAVGVGDVGSGKVPRVVNKSGHAITDGSVHLDENGDAGDKAIIHSIKWSKSVAHGDNNKPDRVISPRPKNERECGHVTVVSTESIDGNGIRDRIGGLKDGDLFQFFSEQYGVKITIHLVLQLAAMMTMRQLADEQGKRRKNIYEGEHSHFLEEFQGILAPAVTIFPQKIQEIIESYSGGNIEEHEMQKLLICAMTHRMDRNAVKKYKGLVRSMAIMAGSGYKRKLYSTIGKSLNTRLTSLLTDSCLMSMVVGTREIATHGKYSMQNNFTTALSSVHSRQAGFGFSDLQDGMINVSMSMVQKEVKRFFGNANDQEKRTMFANKMEKNIDQILKFLENFQDQQVQKGIDRRLRELEGRQLR